MKMQPAIDEFLVFLKVEKNYSDNTIRSYEYDLSCLTDFLAVNKRSDQLIELLPSTVRRFIQDQVMNHFVKPRTLQRRISCLKSFAQFCLKEKWVEIDFTTGVVTPKADIRLPRYMNQEELHRFYRYLEHNADTFALRNHLLFKLLATTGMRRQEIVDLTWEHVDLSSEVIRVIGKGNKERMLPIHPSVSLLFKEYLQGLSESQLHPSQPVFLNRYGNKINPRGLHRMFKELLEKAGLPSNKFSLHHLRHTFATLLLQSKKHKTDIRVLQELLGHTSLSTTSIYTHVNMDQKKEAVESMEME